MCNNNGGYGNDCVVSLFRSHVYGMAQAATMNDIRRRRSILARRIQTVALYVSQEAELRAAVTAALSHLVSDGLAPFLRSFHSLSTLHERVLKAVPYQFVGNRLIYGIVPNCPLQLTLDPILAPYLQKQPRLNLSPCSSFSRHFFIRTIPL